MFEAHQKKPRFFQVGYKKIVSIVTIAPRRHESDSSTLLDNNLTNFWSHI